MFIKSRFRWSCVAFVIGSVTLFAHAFPSLGSTKASMRVQRGGEIKGNSTIAIGAFRVAFVTEDAANSVSHGAFSNGGSAAKMSAILSGVDHALMQKITDRVYADFLTQATAKGFTVIDSTTLVKTSPAYAELAASENFALGRLGTYVTPTGQRSVPLATDDSPKEEKGAAGLGTAFHNIGKGLAKSPANKAFPAAAKEIKAPVLGITVVVNFADFKGTTSSFGSSKASMVPGATIDGRNKNELAPSTSIMGWGPKTDDCAGCQAQFVMEGQIHSDASIVGSSEMLGKKDKKTAVIAVDPAAYETNVVAVAVQANDLLLTALATEK